ncbi:aldose epimerase family protein [Flammeovirga pacifica]|uniref:Aldose 1-epimerase n=1 Tax=Flammeovirga pacifica TaxID=915059 RepID=A0A1S1YTD8_FLAPC|nr:aldose epimerase family protein [Flammeovirga pacifica]OHX64123.1 hypothetical protein NH26_21185 [Flammeovirga pacifica]
MNIKKLILFFLLISSGLMGQKKEFKYSKKLWGKSEHQKVFLLKLTNPNGMSIELTNYGAILVSTFVPDKENNFEDVVLGFDNLAQYQKPNPLFGATVGRYANRIRNGQFSINGKSYQLDTKGEKHSIHGGGEFSSALWHLDDVIKRDHEIGVVFTYYSKEGTHGFPGNVNNKVIYYLTKNNEVRIEFEATTDKDTHISMTNHSYFNLNGLKQNIFNQKIRIDADYITEIDQDIVPTGQLERVINTEKDLTKEVAIKEHIFELNNYGYHFCYVFNKKEKEAKEVIFVSDPLSGRTLTVETTQPSVQFYTGNALDGRFVGKEGITYGKHIAFCLETQHLPDTPNHPNFPSSLLKVGETYKEYVTYKFGIANSSEMK